MNDVAIWLVKGQEACDSSGGCVTMLILTRSPAEPPDVHASFARVRGRDCSLYLIEEIKLLDQFSVEGFLLIDGDALS